MQREDDILAGGLVPTPDMDDPASRVRRTAARLNIPPDIADDYLNVTGKVESGNRQYGAGGRVLQGPPTRRTGARALGMGQVMPDAPGGTTRTIHGQRYDLNDIDQNIEAGLRLFAAGGPDPVGRRLEYFGGAPARRRYERTGKIPEGGDSYTTFQQYVQKSLGPQRRTPAQPTSGTDILAGGLVQSEPTATQPESPQVRELAAIAAQAQAAPPIVPDPRQMPAVEAPAPAQPPRTLTAHDAAWHFGVTPEQAQRLTRRQVRVLNELVAEDERKRAAGEQILPPPLEYQNEMRKRAGLPPQQFNIDQRRAQIGNITLTAPGTTVSPYYQPEAGGDIPQLETPQITIRPGAPFRFQADPNEDIRRQQLIQEETSRRAVERGRKSFTPATPDYFSREAIARTAEERLQQEDPAYEVARQKRVARMGWGEYLAQAPKSVVLGFTDTFATGLKGLAALHKKLDPWTTSRVAKDTKDLPEYKLGQAIQDAVRSLPGPLKSDPDLEQDFIAGQAPSTIGQVFSFMLGGWVSKSPKAAVVLMGGGVTAGDAYDEVRSLGGTDDEAVNAALLAGGLLGPTELIGMRGAMKALRGQTQAATWRAALKTALREGRRDIIENTLQEMGQELGQGIITGDRRGPKQLVEAGILGGFGGTTTIPLTAIANRPRAEAAPMEPSADVVDKGEETQIRLPAERQIVPEQPGAIAAQMDALTNGRGNRLGVLVPKGQSAPTKIPKGYVTTRTSEGVVIHPKELSGEDVRELVDGGETWRLLGHANPEGPTATRIVVARSGREGLGGIKPGDELMASYVEPGQEQNVIDEMRAQFAPYDPQFEVGGEETAAQTVADRAGQPRGWRPGMPHPSRRPGVTAIEEPPATAGAPPTERFAGLSNQQIEEYISSTRQQAERRMARAQERPPKGTAKSVRQARPQIAVRQQHRAETRIAEATAELERRRAGTEGIPSFEQFLETEAGGPAGGINPATLTDDERAALLRQYDAKYYPKPHHSRQQRRQQRTGRFMPGKVAEPAQSIPQIIPASEGANKISAETTLEAAPEGQLFATNQAAPAREPTADEAQAAREPTIPVRPLEKQNALRSYLGNKITMARAQAFDIIPQSWGQKWSKVVDVFGGSGIHGWQLGRALGKKVHYNELDPDVYGFQQLASTNEGQEQLRRVWGPVLDELATLKHQYPEGGTEAHRKVSDWWKATQGRLSKADASSAEKATRVLLENTLGTMGNTQALMSVDHKWKKDIGALGDVSALLDKHRLNAQLWESTSNERAEDLLPKTQPGELVVLDPPYASTKGYTVGNEHGSVNGAVNFIEKSIKPAVDRGVSILYTNSAHLPIVEALRKAGLETRIERVQTQTRTGAQSAFRYEVTAWTPDVSPPRPTDPEVLRGVIQADSTATQRDLSGQTGEELWQTLIRAAQQGEAEPTAPPRRDPVEQTRRDLQAEHTRLVREVSQALAKEQHYSVKGDPVATESVLERVLERANNLRDELLRRIEDGKARGELAKEFPHITAAEITEEAATITPPETPAAPSEPEAAYRPMEGDEVEWTAEGKTQTGKILKVLPSGAYRVRVSGRTAERKQRLPADTEFRPRAKAVKETKHVVGRPKLNTAVDSVEKAIRSLGGIKDDGSGELVLLKQSGKAGLVTKDGRSAEDLAMALAEMGYGRGVWWEGSMRQGDASFTGVNADEFVQAAIEDASGSRRHYSSEYEQDFTAEEEAYWRSQMETAEEKQLDAVKELLDSPRAERLLGAIADGQATNETRQALTDIATRRGVDQDVTTELISLAESESPEQTAARDREVSGETETTPEGQGRSLTEEYIDEEGTLRSASGEPLFRRKGKIEPAGQPINDYDGRAPDVNWDATDLYGKWTHASVAEHLKVPADKNVYRAMVSLGDLRPSRVEQTSAAELRKGEGDVDQMYLDDAEAMLEEWGTLEQHYGNDKFEEWRDALPWSWGEGYDESDVLTLAREMQARYEEVSYDEDEFRFDRGGFPPIVITRQQDGNLVINDGNHRADIWSQQDYDVAPAWVNDELMRNGPDRPLFRRRRKSKGVRLADLHHDRGIGLQVKPQAGQALEAELFDAEALKKRLGLPDSHKVTIDAFPPEREQKGFFLTRLDNLPPPDASEIEDRTDTSVIIRIESADGKHDIDAERRLASDLAPRFEEPPVDLGDVETQKPKEPSAAEKYAREQSSYREITEVMEQLQREREEKPEEAGIQDLTGDDDPLFRRRLETLKEQGYIPVMRRQDTRGEPRTPRTHVFFGPYETSEHGPQFAGYRDYGDKLSVRVIDKGAKIYEGNYSGEFLERKGLYSTPDPLVRQMTKGKYSTLEEVIDVGYDPEIDPSGDLMYRVSQSMAERELKKDGFDGAHWLAEDDLSPEQYQIWNRSVIKRVGEVLPDTRPRAARGKQPAEGTPIRRDGTRITINTETRDALQRAGIFRPGDDGVTITPARAEVWAARLIEDAKTEPKDAAVWKHIARQMRSAAKERGARSVIIATPEAMRHERFHEASEAKAQGNLRQRHARFEELTEHPAFKTSRRFLIAAGYPKDDAMLVEETAAHIAEGDYDDIGLTRKQALDFMELWFKSFAEKNGNVSLDQFQELANEAQQALAAATNKAATETTRAGADEAIRSVSEGRESRAGPRVTETEAFKRWFGDSKVVDKAGQPQVVHHATFAAEDFDAFDPSKTRITTHPTNRYGFYFSSSPDSASAFVKWEKWIMVDDGSSDLGIPGGRIEKNPRPQQEHGFEEGARVLPVFLRITNPLRLTAEQFLTRGEGEFRNDEGWLDIPTLRKAGYDGIIVKQAPKRSELRQSSEFQAVNYVVFEPNQIKSAIGNRGTFDPDEANILFRRRRKETDETYTGRTKTPLDRLREVAQKRQQTIREAPARPTRPEAAPTRAAVTHKPGERSFPKTAERAGYHGGTDRDYTVLTNQASLEEAERRLLKLGQSRAAAELAQSDSHGAPEMAMGILLMQRFEGKGDIGRAVAVANDLSRKLTRAGQFVQAASIISRLSPEGVLLHAQKILKGKPLAEATALTLVQQAKAVSDAERLIAEIQKQRPDIFGPSGEVLPRPTAALPAAARRSAGRKTTRATIGTLHDRLAQMEQDARARMQARATAAQQQIAAAPAKSQRGAAIKPTAVAADLGDLVIIGAAKLTRKGITLAVWLSEMKAEAPHLTRRDLRRLYLESFERFERERRQFLQESRMRGVDRSAVKAGQPTPTSTQEYQRIINERLDAQTAARRARTELARSYRDLGAGRTIRALRTARDVWNLTRSLITSLDLSAAGRQGKMGLVTHPKAFIRGFGRQFKALSTKQFERMVSEMQLDPDYRYAQRFKLELTSLAGTEEVFQSELAGKIPWVKQSQQAYDTMLDTLRFGWFKAQLAKYRAANINLEDPDLKEGFIRDTNLINAFTGRGGGKFLQKHGQTLSVAFFSPKFWASRLKVLSMPLDPRMYGLGKTAYSAQARKDAWLTLFGFYGLMTFQAALAVALGGVASFDPEDPDFVFNPDSADFMKVRFGNVHVDFSAGLQTHMRVAARLAKMFYMREFQKGKPRKEPSEIIGQYLRSKEAPNPALLHDLFFSRKKDTEHGQVGTDFAGQPVFLLGEPGKGGMKRLQSSALGQRIIPIVLQDALDAYQQGIGLKQGGISWAAATLGEGIHTYAPRYSEHREKWPMKTELDKLGITINPPQRIKPGKYDKFKAETDEEYDARRQAEAASIKKELQRLERMSYYKKLSPRDQEAEIRAAIKAGREAVRDTMPAKIRQLDASP